MKCVVNSFELFLYYCFFTAMIFWTHYKLFEAQTEILSRNPFVRFRDLSPGWKFLDRKKDTSDIEWNCWKYYLDKSWLYLAIQFLVSETLRRFKFSTSVVKYWYILSSMFFISFFMGFSQLIMILVQPIILLIVMLFGGKRTSIWITSLILLSRHNISIYSRNFWHFLDDGSSLEKVPLLIYAMGWSILRCIAYCIDSIERQENVFKTGEKKERENVQQIVTNCFSYVLYMPVLYVGPMISYRDFENSFQHTSESLWLRLKSFIVDIILFITYSFLLDFFLHWFYFKAMLSGMKFIKQLPSSALCGGGLWMALVLYVKYVIVYGTGSAFARLDNMDPPSTPRCIARMHVSSNVWRHFDVGMYKFMLNYIYKPCYNALFKYVTLPRLLLKQLVSFVTFSFILLWHGLTLDIFIWVVFNYICISLENTVQALSRTNWYNYFKEKVLKTEAMEVRFIACLYSPLIVLSVVSGFYFFGGAKVGHLYVGQLEWPAPHNVMLVLLTGYCCGHVSISLLDVPSRTDRRRHPINS